MLECQSVNVLALDANQPTSPRLRGTPTNQPRDACVAPTNSPSYHQPTELPPHNFSESRYFI
ncbi:MAG: hypothetical protein ACPGWR_11095 [Ardenticatenaceae bacterium]